MDQSFQAPTQPNPSLPATRLRRVEVLAQQQGGVVSRTQAYAASLTRGFVRSQIRAGRWQKVGAQCLCLHTGPLSQTGQFWAAVFEGGPRAHLDGATSLIASGLTNFTEESIRVSVPKGARIQQRRRGRLAIRETRRFHLDDLAPSGVPRTRPAIAAVRGALWAASDRQAQLLVTMAVQQGLCLVEDVAAELMRIRRDKRRRLLNDLVIDLAGGIRSLGELDFVRGCRDRGLPPPSSQVLRRSKDNRYYLDFRWAAWKVVVEIDGIQHSWAQNSVQDALRHNSIAVDGDVVLRLPVLGLRVCPDDFFAQVAEALRRAGFSDQQSA